MEHRQEILPYNQRKWEIYRLTADAAGEEALHEYLCVATAVWDNGERIFPDIKTFEKASTARGSIKNQVLAHYMTLLRVANDHIAPIETEIGFFRDYGFIDKDGNIYDVNKKNIVANIFKDDEETKQEDILSGFTTDDGQVVERNVHPSLASLDKEDPDDTDG